MPPLPSIPGQSPFLPWVLAQYGATMACVQAWEAQLAVLAGAASLKPSSGRKVNLERDLRKATRQSWHLLQKASASELRNLLRDKAESDVITDELLTEISDLIRWRDFLAHRYLRSRVMQDGGMRPTPQQAVELFKLGQSFSESSTRVGNATATILGSIPPPKDVPDGVREVLERMAMDIAQAQPLPFTGEPGDGKARDASESPS